MKKSLIALAVLGFAGAAMAAVEKIVAAGGSVK